MLAGWKSLGVGVADVVGERAVGAGAGRGDGFGVERRAVHATGESGGGESGEQAGGDGFDVALDAGELAGEDEARVLLQLQGWR